MKRLIGFLAVFIVLFFPSTAAARSYQYDLIKIDYTVNRDSTVDVEEVQSFRYEGSYNKGWRSISHKGTSAITDISVWDGETGKELTRSYFDLDKTDPSSWGKYYISETPESSDVSWYYDMEDTTHIWTVKYKLHGAISFLKDKDELYWNAIGDQYEVPIGAADIRVHIPDGADKAGLSSAIYIDGGSDFIAAKDIVDERTFEFSAVNVPPNSFVTIAAGWPKGLVDYKSYWKDFAKIHWQWPAAAALVFVFITLWRKMKKRREDWKGVVVPQYEPPGDLKPAMAKILLYGYSGGNYMAATIVDLAVRKYVSIEERESTEEEKKSDRAGRVVGVVVLFAFTLLFILPFAASSLSMIFSGEGTGLIVGIFLAMFLVIFIRLFVGSIFKVRKPSPRYVVRRTEKELGGDVEDYEREMMEIIFAEGDFDTGKMKASPTKAQEMSQKLFKIEGILREEARKDTGAFEKKKWTAPKVALAVFGTIAGLIAIMASFTMFIFEPFVSVLIFGASVTFMMWMFSERYTLIGRELHEKWLGFKLYLETAEKYRLQNLTPDLFEKYLPYAMIFGLEDKWAKAFEGMAVSSPDWYTGASSASFAHGVSSGGFSPSAFTSGFSSSFASVFATATGTSSSGGSGGSGGGGSSGGGGGGGGGGAS